MGSDRPPGTFIFVKYSVSNEEWRIVPKPTDGGAGVEDDLRSVDAVHEPVLRMVASVADVDGNAPVDGLEDPVPCVTLAQKILFLTLVTVNDLVFNGIASTMSFLTDVIDATEEFLAGYNKEK